MCGFFPIKDTQTFVKDTPPPSEVLEMLWKTVNELYSMGKIILKLYNSYFSSYGWKFIENLGHFEYKKGP